jgi:lipoprotein signal peptidase
MSYLKGGIWIGILFWIDLLTKYLFCDCWIGKDLWLFEPVVNHWISWWISASLYIVIPVSILWIVAFFWLWKKKYLSDIVLIFLLAWTLWNLFDRIFLWGVRDFISIWKFPVFNMADVYLTIGVIRLIIEDLWVLQYLKKWLKK